MDFVEGLPTSGRANAIMVVVDRYSKFAHFIALHHPFSAASVSQLFIDNIYRFMACLYLLCLIATGFSQASFGSCSFLWLAPLFA
jgi:hypothetical protein